MKKFFSLLKASCKGDLNVFRIKGKGKSNILVIGILSVMMMVISYSYADMLMTPLQEFNLAYIGLTLFSLVIVMVTILEGIYKSEGIIFDAKDNNLLFAMPIKRSYILAIRFIKVLIFDYIFEVLFLAPAFVKYAMIVSPRISFYFISILFLILLPLIPLIIASIIGYLVKAVSTRFKSKKLFQTLISLLLFFGIYAVSFNLQGLINNIVEKATSINEIISKIYLPIGLFIDLIIEFDIIKLILLILISILPFVVFVNAFSSFYDKIINKDKEHGSNSSKKVSEIKSKSVVRALTIKELKTYFSIPVYIINTIIGPILGVIFPVFLMFKYDDIVKSLTSSEVGLSIDTINRFSPYLFIGIIILLLSLSTITVSSVSLEGKKISLIKSLPIRPKDIFKSKILASDIIMIPFFLIGATLYIIKMGIYDYNIIFIFLACIIFPHINAQIGLLVNLKYPKLDFNSEVEVIKQSMAVLVCIIIGMIISLGSILLFNPLMNLLGGTLAISSYFVIAIVVLTILNKIINTYGVKKFNEIN